MRAQLHFILEPEMKLGFQERGLARGSWSGIESGRRKERRLAVI